MTDNKNLIGAFVPATLAKAQILVVDDSDIIRSTTTMFLEDAGFSCLHTAVDGMDALKVLRSQHVDVVLSDIQMPNLDGISLVQQIKADSSLQNIPVILTSSAFDLEGLAMKKGADGFLAKGGDLDLMVGMVSRFAEQSLAQYEDASALPAPAGPAPERHHP